MTSPTAVQGVTNRITYSSHVPISSLTTTRMVRTPPITTLALLDYSVLPPSESLRKTFGELLCLLKIITSESPYSPELDHHYFCFQPTHDLSKISAVFLSVHIYSGIEYKIHLNDIRFDDPDSCSGQVLVAELEEYANRVLSRVRVSFVHTCIKPLSQRSKTQDYSDQLIKNGIIHDTSPFADVDLLTCPLCDSRLRSCEDCDATSACPNNDCPGSGIVDFEQCDEHEWVTCHECLNSEGLGPDSTFVRCPSCNSWCCCLEVSWCPGGIIHPAAGMKEPVELDLSIARSHPPIPGPCGSCIDSGHVAAWKACGVGRSDRCPSHAKLSKNPLHYAYCPECITEHKGRCCACGGVWLCDDCPANVDVFFLTYHHRTVISCPRCGATYCREQDGCQYCSFCQICCQTGPCFGCQAREKGDVAREDTLGECPQRVNTFEACLDCQIEMCNECCSTGKDGVTECSGCHGWMCGECAQTSRTSLCRSCH